MKYRLISKIVEAFQLIRDVEVIAPAWFTQAVIDGQISFDRSIVDGAVHLYGCTVETSVGRQKAKIGDYVIRAPDGRLSVCKKRDFEKDYKPGGDDHDTGHDH